MTFLTDERGKPFLPLGLQAHNSSTGTDLICRAFQAVRAYGGNCLEAPIYWYQIEPERDCYCMDLVRTVIDQAREASIRLILLWFGMSKNGHPNYVPEYMKLDPGTYRLVTGPDGAALPALTPHCRATLERDKRAFCKVMEYLREYDGSEKTVVAVQIENEMGCAGTDRDYSPEAEALYRQEVPEELRGVTLKDSGTERIGALTEISGTGEPGNAACASGAGGTGCPKGGPGTGEPGNAACASEADGIGCPGISPWKRQFGRHAQEAFCAWHHARYVGEIAAAGKAIYPLTLYTNVMVGENGYEEPGLCYNSGAAVSRMLDIWKVGAPALDLIGPDIYNENRRDYERICRSYDREDNPLFIPESPIAGEANAMNALLAAADYGAVGICCFGAESALDEEGNLNEECRSMVLTMRTLNAMAPLLIRYRKTGRVYAIAEEEFENYHYLKLPRYHVVAHYLHDSPMNLGYTQDTRSREGAKKRKVRGRGLLVQTGEHEFYLGGAGIALDFIKRPRPEAEDSYRQLSSRYAGQLNFLTVEEGHFEGDTWVTDRYRNGDETNFSQYVLEGQVIRIRLNPVTGME